MVKNYKNYLTNYAKQRRKNQTFVESMLWSRLRAKRFLNLKFKRQQPIDKYIVDFYCDEFNLIIELDGASHTEEKFSYDKTREKDLLEMGYKVIRFSEGEVTNSIDNVLETLSLILSQGEGIT